jgi:mono/diheme cytochrome c family protein
VAVSRALLACSLLAAACAAPAQSFRHWDPLDTGAVPRLVSQTGFYVDLARGRRVTPEAVPFEVNSPLWSDGSAKQRWVVLKPGTAIAFSDTGDAMEYPDGAVFVKNFSIDTVPGDAASRVLWETRFLVLKKRPSEGGAPGETLDEWFPYSYKWRPDQRDADLVPDTGLKATIRVHDRGVGGPARSKKWVFPSTGECARCHANGQAGIYKARSVLGFFTAQLNRPSGEKPGVNQLQDFFDRGLLKGARPASFSALPRWYPLDAKDPEATLDVRARSYLGANCSGCHGRNGFPFTHARGPNFDFHAMKPDTALEYLPAGWDWGLDTLAPAAPFDDFLRGVYIINPGYPQKSVARLRLATRNQADVSTIEAFDSHIRQMPPLATFEPHEEALRVIDEWILSMPRRTVPIAIASAASATRPSPIFRGRSFQVPPALLAGRPRIVLTGLDGRSVALRSLGQGLFALPASAPAGVYVLRIGSSVFTRSVW